MIRINAILLEALQILGYASSMKEVFNLLKQYDIEFVIIGGTALKNYLHERTLTPDIDILVQDSDFSKVQDMLKKKEVHFKPNAFGISFEMGGAEYDVLATDSAPREFAFKDSKPFSLGGRITSLEALLAMKLEAGRDKDLKDVLDILKSGKLDVEKMKKVAKKLGIYEDFKSEWQIAKYR